MAELLKNKVNITIDVAKYLDKSGETLTPADRWQLRDFQLSDSIYNEQYYILD